MYCHCYHILLLVDHLGPILEAADHFLTLTGVNVLRVLSIFWIRLLIAGDTHTHRRVCCLLFHELYFVYKMNID